MLTENNIPEKKDFSYSTKDRCEIQSKLIEEFCHIKEIEDAEKRNVCVGAWIQKYGDNFDQLDATLVEQYKNAKDEIERESALDTIQKALEKLNEVNG